jgi:hypothetical protein
MCNIQHLSDSLLANQT